MDRVLFQNILEQLDIDFDGRIDFSRYHVS